MFCCCLFYLALFCFLCFCFVWFCLFGFSWFGLVLFYLFNLVRFGYDFITSLFSLFDLFGFDNWSHALPHANGH